MNKKKEESRSSIGVSESVLDRIKLGSPPEGLEGMVGIAVTNAVLGEVLIIPPIKEDGKKTMIDRIKNAISFISFAIVRFLSPTCLF